MTKTADTRAGMPQPPVFGTVPVETAVRAGISERTVLIYIVMALLALVPGIAAMAWPDSLRGTAVGSELQRISAALHDIRFGSGLRFWLGISGATAMGLLLIYPLRKMIARSRSIGSVGLWFHLHIVLGLLGPVLVLYHCNFGFGGTNANVALWAMGVIAVSGIVGYFVYTRASADFYGEKQLANRRLNAVSAAIGEPGSALPACDGLIAALDAVEADLLTPRKGLIESLRARLGLEARRRQIFKDAAWIVQTCASERRLSVADSRSLANNVAMALRVFFATARRASTRSLGAQLWAGWRNFHLPVFLIMTVAIGLHVHAVWDIDRPLAGTTTDTVGKGAETVKSGGPAAKISQQRVAVVTIPQAAAKDPAVVPPAAVTVPVPVPVPARPRPATKTDPVDATPPAIKPEPPRPAVQAQQPPSPVPPPVAVQPPAPSVQAIAKPEMRLTPPPPPLPQPTPPPAARAKSDPIEELQRRLEAQQPPPGPGGLRPVTVAQQIAEMKIKFAAGGFTHSVAETGFALTGKHLKVECSACHTKPLRDTRQPDPRQCIACHKKDDAHRGRRPDCAQCHKPTRWTDRIKNE